MYYPDVLTADWLEIKENDLNRKKTMDIYPTKIYITKYTIGSICLKVNTEYDICSGKTSSLKMQEIRLCSFVGS